MTMLDPLHEKQTQAFIDQNPISVVVIRRTKVDLPDGGHRWKEAALAAQTMRKVASNRQGDVDKVLGPDGQLVVPVFTLIAMPQAVIKREDYVKLEGSTFYVAKASNDPPWARRASIIDRSGPDA